MNLTACRSLRAGPLTGTWYRAIRAHHFATALAYTHTNSIPGRFNAGSVARPGFPILYFGEDHQVTLFEVAALLGSPLPGQAYAPNPVSPWTVINVTVNLSRVVDLTRRSQRALIATTTQELTGDWRGYALRTPAPAVTAPWWTNVPTQRLGAALHARRSLEGFSTWSAKVPTRRSLIVFPDRLRAGSFIRFVDPASGASHSIP